MRRDRALWAAVALGLLVRWLPLVLWGFGGCVRDECTYRGLARGIVAGQGMVAPEGWLWAPGWPYVLAASLAATGSVNSAKYLQVALSLGCIVWMYAIADRVFDRRTARIAAFAFAIHPTLAFYSGTLWSEGIYTFGLLSAVLALLWARDGLWTRAFWVGVALGGCVLFRGVATYMAPIFALALVLPAQETWTDALQQRWRHVAMLVLALVLVVGPYSLSASRRHGGFIVSDATLGQMMWLGNNDFAPVTFDWGNGYTQDIAYDAEKLNGRPHCDVAMPAAQWDDCEVDHGVQWIKDHPAEFVGRIPVRIAQLFNPHTFLTRHLRWGKWQGLPFELKETLVLYTLLTSFVTILGGGVAGMLKARGPFGMLAAMIVGYHVVAISILAGLSRYRLPLEPFGLLFVAAVLADFPGTWTAAKAQPWRIALAVAWLAAATPLVVWYLPSGFPGPW